MNITPLDAEQFTRGYVILFLLSFSFNAGRRRRNGYSRRFNRVRPASSLLEQLKPYTSERSSKLEKASTDAESALALSKQLKVERELKFS